MIVVVIMLLVDDQKVRLDIQNAVEVEGIAAEHGIERDGAILRPMQLRIGIDGADAGLDLVKFVRADEIGLVEQDHIGESDLILGLGRILQPFRQPFRIGDRHDGVEPRRRLNIGIDEKGLRDGRRIGETCRLDDDRSRTCPCASSGLR